MALFASVRSLSHGCVFTLQRPPSKHASLSPSPFPPPALHLSSSPPFLTLFSSVFLTSVFLSYPSSLLLFSSPSLTPSSLLLCFSSPSLPLRLPPLFTVCGCILPLSVSLVCHVHLQIMGKRSSTSIFSGLFLAGVRISEMEKCV